jgi:hypothetical protein
MLRRAARVVNISRRTFGADHGHHHHGPHVPEFYDRLAYSCLTVCFLWIMYRAKENKGQLLVSEDLYASSAMLWNISAPKFIAEISD